jgi:hypothetical protein
MLETHSWECTHNSFIIVLLENIGEVVALNPAKRTGGQWKPLCTIAQFEVVGTNALLGTGCITRSRGSYTEH